MMKNRNAQNGGIATAFFKCVLESGYVDAVVVAGEEKERPWKPIPLIIDIENISILYESQKSKYFPSGMLLGLKEAVEKGYKKLAMSLLPCQLHGLINMRMHNFTRYIEHIGLTVGLFCFGTYWYNDFIKWLVKKYKVDVGDISKLDLNRGNFIIYLKNGHFITGKRIEIMKILRGSCKTCSDFTGIFADISLGEVGSPQGWTTIIVRSQKALKILEEMEESNIITLNPLPAFNLEILYGLVVLKHKYHVTKSVLKWSDEKVEKMIEKTRKIPMKTLLDISLIRIATNTRIALYMKNLGMSYEEIDPNILSNFIAAITDFSKTLTREHVELKSVDLGAWKIVIEHGEYVRVLALAKEDSETIRMVLRSILTEIEAKKLHEKAENLEDINKIERNRFYNFFQHF